MQAMQQAAQARNARACGGSHRRRQYLAECHISQTVEGGKRQVLKPYREQRRLARYCRPHAAMANVPFVGTTRSAGRSPGYRNSRQNLHVHISRRKCCIQEAA